MASGRIPWSVYSSIECYGTLRSDLRPPIFRLPYPATSACQFLRHPHADAAVALVGHAGGPPYRRGRCAGNTATFVSGIRGRPILRVFFVTTRYYGHRKKKLAKVSSAMKPAPPLLWLNEEPDRC